MIGELFNHIGQEITDGAPELQGILSEVYTVAATGFGGQNALGVNADAPSIKPRALTF